MKQLNTLIPAAESASRSLVKPASLTLPPMRKKRLRPMLVRRRGKAITQGIGMERIADGKQKQRSRD